MSETNVCPKCGMDRNLRDDLLFECGSIDEWCSSKTGTKVDFRQSDKCRIRELENQLAAVTAERDAKTIECEDMKNVALKAIQENESWQNELLAVENIARSKTVECRRWERLHEIIIGDDNFAIYRDHLGHWHVFDKCRPGGDGLWKEAFPTPLDALAAIEKYEQSNISTEKTS